MKTSNHRLLLIFLDGVGLAPASVDNPFTAGAMPTLERWLGGSLTIDRVGRTAPATLLALDANLEVDGLPQSATGQTTLFTGVNAAEALGRHVPALPGPRLRAIIERHSLFRRARELGREVTFANAYTERYLEQLAQGTRRPSTTSAAVRAAGLAFRSEVELARGDAVTWDITGEDFARRAEVDIEPVTAEIAGGRLAGLAARHHLTVFETFLSDLVGHRRMNITPAEVLARFDGLFRGLERNLPPEVTLLVTSDHGNLEETAHRSHTRNPVPLIVRGPASGAFAAARSLADVTPILLAVLEASNAGHGASR